MVIRPDNAKFPLGLVLVDYANIFIHGKGDFWFKLESNQTSFCTEVNTQSKWKMPTYVLRMLFPWDPWTLISIHRHLKLIFLCMKYAAWNADTYLHLHWNLRHSYMWKKQLRNLDINPHKSVIKLFKCKCHRAGSEFTRHHIHYWFTTAESRVLKFPHATLKQQKADGGWNSNKLKPPITLHLTAAMWKMTSI